MVKNERRSQRRTRQNNTTIPCRIQRNRPKPRRIHVLYIGTLHRGFRKENLQTMQEGQGTQQIEIGNPISTSNAGKARAL